MTTNKKAIEAYYPHIDNVDIDWVIALFHEDAVYQRADIIYRGLAELRKFFFEERQIRGEHIVDALWADDATETVFVTGRFEGQGVAGDPRSVAFADVWRFDDAGLVVRRQTYLGLGHAYVER